MEINVGGTGAMGDRIRTDSGAGALGDALESPYFDPWDGGAAAGTMFLIWAPTAAKAPLAFDADQWIVMPAISGQ